MGNLQSFLTPEEKLQNKRERTVSRQEAVDGIYIDFEGFTDQPPSLVGVYMSGFFEQFILDIRLKEIARYKGLPFSDGSTWASSLLSLASQKRRRIFAYSSHEKTVFRKHYDLSLDDVYADARMIAKVLRRRLKYPPGDPPRSLKDYLECIEFPRGNHLGERKSTSRLNSVISMVEKKGDFDSLTPVVKAKWTKLLDHNRIDVLGMRQLVLLSTENTLPPNQQ